MHVSITVNGEKVAREIEPRLLLVHFIRETPGLTGTHWGPIPLSWALAFWTMRPRILCGARVAR